jgi:hypothetical protein
VGGERGLEHVHVLEAEWGSCLTEQGLAGPEDDGGDGDGELLDVAGGEGLTDGVGAAHDVDVLAVGGGGGLDDGLVEAGDEGEAGVGGGVLGVVGEDEEGDAPGVLAAQASAAS